MKVHIIAHSSNPEFQNNLGYKIDILPWSYSQQNSCYCLRVIPIVFHILNTDVDFFPSSQVDFLENSTYKMRLLVRHGVLDQNLVFDS
jgi:hypothetical protein